MYHQHFGLNEAPFSIAVNPRYLFMSQRHRDALAHLLYGVSGGGGFILLTGEVGTGKTTVNRCLLEQLPDTTDLAIILNPALSAVELLATACDELSIDYPEGTSSLKALTDALHRFLLSNHELGRKTVLMIDEAQHLDFDVLEQIRLLTNLETNDEKLLQIILIGQPELTEKLARPELRQLNQRITARYNLQPLNLQETGAYIKHRLEVAGLKGNLGLFEPGAIKKTHHLTRGIPRLINVLCDRALLGAYGQKRSTVNKKLITEASREVFGEFSTGESSSGAFWRATRIGLFVVGCLALTAYGLVQLSNPETNTRKTSGSETSGSETRGAANQSSSRAISQAASSGPLKSAPLQSEPLKSEPLKSDVAQSGASQSLPSQFGAVNPSASNTTSALGGSASAVAQLDRQPLANSQKLAADEALTSRLWELSLSEASTRFWRAASDSPSPMSVCPPPPITGLVCTRGQAQVWDELASLNRPVLLDMVTRDKFAAATLVLQINGTRAVVWTHNGMADLQLAELADSWTGVYQYLWQPPAGWSGALGLGDTSSSVPVVARMFATLDRMSVREITRYNADLETRVRLFQESEGLNADGVVGERTLLRLNDRLGIGLTSERAVARAQLWQETL